MTPISGTYLKSIGFIYNNHVYKRADCYIGYDGVNWLIHGWLKVNSVKELKMWLSAWFQDIKYN